MNINDVMISFFIKASIISVCILILKLSSILLQKKLTFQRIYMLWITLVAFSLLPIDFIFNRNIFRTIGFNSSNKVLGTLNIPSRELVEVVYKLDSSNISSLSILFYIWLSGAIISLIYIFIKYALFTKHIQRWLTPETDSKTLKYVEEEKTKININKKINVYQCAIIQTPMLYGIIKPLILLPKSSISIDPLVIRHEIIHYKRKDFIIKLLTQFSIAIYWFNPLIYLLRSTLNTFCELSCDELVLKNQSPTIKEKYFDILLETILVSNNHYTVLVNEFSNVAKTKLRLKGILDERPKSNRRIVSVILIAFLIASNFLIGYNTNSSSNTDTRSGSTLPNLNSNSSTNANSDKKFDARNNDIYTEPITITYDSFEDIRSILEHYKDVVLKKEIDGYTYEGTSKIWMAVFNEETRKWDATFKGKLYKKR